MLTAAEIEALRCGGFQVEGEEIGGENPLSKTAIEFSNLLSSCLTPTQVAERLRVSPGQVHRRLSHRPPSLYGIRWESGWLVPAFQFEFELLIPGMNAVAACLDPELHPISVFRWFTLPSPDLAVDDDTRALSPREWLLAGLPVEDVVALASDL